MVHYVRPKCLKLMLLHHSSIYSVLSSLSSTSVAAAAILTVQLCNNNRKFIRTSRMFSTSRRDIETAIWWYGGSSIGKAHLQCVRWMEEGNWRSHITDTIFRAKEIPHTEMVYYNSKGNREKEGQKIEHNISNLFYWTRFLLNREIKTAHTMNTERHKNKMWIVNTIVIDCIKNRTNARKWLEYVWHWPLSSFI